MTKSFFSFLLLLVALSSYAQSGNQSISLPTIIPASPDAQALARYAEIPVGYSTGVPDISIPIYNLRAGKLSLPISISYHASGIKVRDIASVAGLGWVLNAGGSISRTVLGRRDESNDYQAPYKTTDDLSNARAAVGNDNGMRDLIYYLQNMNKLKFETQSDRYAYNFNGKAGIFRYDWLNGNVHLVPYAPLKITKEYLNGNNSPISLYYKIVDEDGVQYFFEGTESTEQNGMLPVTAWNLTRVVSADQKDAINLYYSNPGEGIVQVSEQCTIVKNPGNGVGGWSPYAIAPITTFTRTPIGAQFAPQRLDSIVAKDAKVRFEYAADRQDGRQMRLLKVCVYNRRSKILIRQASLSHSYFGAASNHTLRLRLDAINLGTAQNSEVEKYAFAYNNSIGPGYYTTPGYVFPGGSSFPTHIEEDYWGYSGPIGGIPSEFLSFLNPSELATYGGNKNPDVNQVQGGIIRQIQYPTGGKTVFEFESNTTNDPYFYGYPNQTNPNNGVIGGLRVKTIKSFDADNSLAFQKTYTYDGIGAQQKISAVLFRYQQPIHYVESLMNNGVYAGLNDLGTIVNDVATSSSVYPLSIMGSSPVIYSQVTEYNGTTLNNTGKTVYEYTIPPETTLESSNILASPKYISEFTVDRGTPNPLLASKTAFKNINGVYTKLNQIENQFSYARSNEFLTGIRVDQETMFYDREGHFSPDDYDTPYLNDYLNSYTWEATKGHEDVPLLATTITTDYSTPSAPLVTITSYDYGNLDHLQPTQKTVTRSTGDNLITQYKYPHDYAGQNQSPYINMVNDLHIWNPVIEEFTYKNSTSNFLQSTRTNYNFFNADNKQIYPSVIETRKGTGIYEPRVTYNSYDNHGNPLSVSKASGPSTSYLWGYNGQYPVAEVRNASYQDLVNVLGQNVVDQLANNTPVFDADVQNELNPLRTSAALQKAEVTTYTYKPLVGMTSKTDAKGMATYYEYDNFQRLYRVKDRNGNILKQYCYNYAGQQTDCSVPIAQTGSAAIYARVEVTGVNYVYNGNDPSQQVGNQDERADVYIRFYSDAACTIPYVLTLNMDVDMQQQYNYNDQNGPVQYTYVNTYTASSGYSEIYLGNITVASSSSYNDPYYGYITSNYSFIYTLVGHAGSNYNPEDTYGYY